MERDEDERASQQREKEASDSKVSKSTRKKKAASGKKSRKKKSKQESQSNQFAGASPDLDVLDPGQSSEREKTERLEKTTKVRDLEKEPGVRSEEDEKNETQHSMSRSRSGSRNRFSSLFRRKKRYKSETDLQNENGNGNKEDEGEEKQTENSRRKDKRHVSMEDLKKKQQKHQQEELSPQPPKSNLKRSSPYLEFSSKTKPRDRLQHMTLREVAKEQRERRSESLPRRRREYVSFDDRDPTSSPTLSASPTDFPDYHPAFSNSQTLPRDSSRYSSLTPQHSSNNFSDTPLEMGATYLNHGQNASAQRPPDNVMESSQDSGVVALGQQQTRRDSSVVKQEKTSMEKLLELKQNFPHAFIYDVEKDASEECERVVEENTISPQNNSSGAEMIETPNDAANPFLVSDKKDQYLPNVDQTTDTPHTPHSSALSDITPSPSSTTTQHTTPTRQQVYTTSKITSSPSFLDPLEGINSSGASSRVTSMTSSHRSSDLGYVDGDDSVPDDDDEEDDDNSAFSTPPEDLFSENHKNRSYVHPEMLEKYLSSVLANKAGHDMPLPEIDIYEAENEKKVYPNATLPTTSRKMPEPYLTYEMRKASRNLKRSSSDVIDRRRKSPVKNYSGAILSDDHSKAHESPVGSVDTLSDLSFEPLHATAIADTSKFKEDTDGDRASLASTGTLIHPDGKSLGFPVSQQPVSDREDRPLDIKSVPVMGTAAQSIHRRNFSPLRPRKIQYLHSTSQPEPPPQTDIEPECIQKENISNAQIPADNTPGSFQPIQSSNEDVSIDKYTHENMEKNDECSQNDEGTKMTYASTSESTDIEFQPSAQYSPTQNIERPTPVYLITGLELQTKSPMPKKVNSLMDCLNDQSLLAQNNEVKRKKSVKERKKDKIKVEKSCGSENELKDKSDEEKTNLAEQKDTELNERKLVSLKDKECQTPPWLLDDLIASKTEPTKKSKGILGRRKKQSFKLKPLSTSLSPGNRETLDIPPSTASVSPSTASTCDGMYMTPPTTATTADDDVILRVDNPVSPESDVSNKSPLPGASTLSNDDPKASDETNEETKNVGPSKESVAKPTNKSKPLSLSAVILLKNRIKNYRDKKKEKKESASGNKMEEEATVENENPSDTFMTIENEINLSKLEVSKETDIVDVDYFEPEFSLDYSKKQIRFEDITPPNEPVQSEEPLPPLPATATRRLRQRRESTMREKRRKCISYCKRFVAFLFSHIGLCSLVVAYTILGGFIFQALESQAETAVKTDIKSKRSQILGQIISLALGLEKSEEGVSNLTSLINSTLLQWQKDIHHATKDQGWDGTEKMGNEGVWSFASSLLYAITVTTTIGYGHVAPKTPEGRLVTIGYAVVGIPLTLLCLTNIGDVMATGFRLLYGKVCCGICCTMFKPRRRRMPPDLEKGLGRTMITSEKEESDKPKEVIHVPTSLCLLLIAAYIFAGAMLFSMWEKWDILTGSYFCFITLSTIGFGDIVPGMETNAWSGEEKLVLCALYLVFGLSLIAMCFNLVQEDVKTKCRWLGMKLGIVDKPETPM